MSLVRVIDVHVDGETHLALEVDQRVLDEMNWVHGEILQLEVSEDKKSLTLKPTGYVHNESGTVED